MSDINYCPQCGGPVLPHSVAGEQRNHLFCSRCLLPVQSAPRIVVTVFVASGKRLLWVQRALEPARGKWAIPGGFLENGEMLTEGAARELREEAGINLAAEQLQLYMAGTITFMNQLYIGFRASVDTTTCAPGVESMRCEFFSRQECPWNEVAYPQVNDSILQAYDDLDSGRFGVWEAEMSLNHYALRPVRLSR